MWALKLPLEEVEDMTWAEFQLRSFGFWQDRKFQMQMTREIAYEIHQGHYVWGKKKPPKKNEYWDLDGNKQAKEDAIVQALRKAIKSKKNG